jgi:subtilisin family serine protease
VDLSAPGVSVFNLLGNGLYGNSLSGTSFATPAVTGAAALLMSIPSKRFCSLIKEQPANAAITIINSIRQGVDKISDLKEVSVTGGRLNIFKALAELTTRFSDGIGDLPSIKLIYPNPVVGTDLFFYTNFEEGDAYTFTVYDATGRLVSSESKLAASIIEKVDVSPLAAGAYYVKIATPKGSDMAKIIKQ